MMQVVYLLFRLENEILIEARANKVKILITLTKCGVLDLTEKKRLYLNCLNTVTYDFKAPRPKSQMAGVLQLYAL